MTACSSALSYVRGGHTSEAFGGEMLVFGGSAGTLHPNTVHALNLEHARCVLNRRPVPDAAELLTSAPVSTDHHLAFEYDDAFLYELWDADEETICLERDTRADCTSVLSRASRNGPDQTASMVSPSTIASDSGVDGTCAFTTHKVHIDSDARGALAADGGGRGRRGCGGDAGRGGRQSPGYSL